MPNIKFSYLYRDAGNYKNFNNIIFGNPESIDLQVLTTLIHSKLIGGEYFYAHQWQVPDLHFGTWNNELDHTFHEFESVDYTHKDANSMISLVDFIKRLKAL